MHEVTILSCQNIMHLSRANFIFIDIDGTMIGDILPQIAEWEIITKFEKSKMANFKKNLKIQLQNGLLRPNISSFIDTIKANNSDCEFFIYTASNPAWAHFIIGVIESTIGFKFNRPLFTRDHCFSSKHSQKNLYDVCSIAFNKKRTVYIERKIKTAKDFYQKSILIDNNHVLPKHEQTKLLVCPTYSYKDTYDVTRLVSEDTLSTNYLEISRILYHCDLFPKVESNHFSYPVFKSIYFSHLGNVIKDGVKNKQNKDTFWELLF